MKIKVCKGFISLFVDCGQGVSFHHDIGKKEGQVCSWADWPTLQEPPVFHSISD